MHRALFPGSFDPPTLGHLDIIQRASPLFDQLYIGIAQNPLKAPSPFTLEERIAMLQEITHHLPNVTILSFTGLTVDFAKQHSITTLLRGLRAFSDWAQESSLALANRSLTSLETLFLIADVRFAHISSSLIRELAPHQRLHNLVPPSLEQRITARLS